MYKNPRWLATRLGGLCLVLAIWVIADNAYRDFEHKKYLQCVWQGANESARLMTNIYKEFELSELRNNCANSLGPEYMAWDDEISISWFQSPIWKKVLLLPSYFSGVF
jgi:hypothetical protein